MTTTAIRKKLSNFMQVADDKKVKAVYALLDDDIEQEESQYTDEFKAELDKRYAYYKGGGKIVNSSVADKQIKQLLQLPT